LIGVTGDRITVLATALLAVHVTAVQPHPSGPLVVRVPSLQQRVYLNVVVVPDEVVGRSCGTDVLLGVESLARLQLVLQPKAPDLDDTLAGPQRITGETAAAVGALLSVERPTVQETVSLPASFEEEQANEVVDSIEIPEFGRYKDADEAGTKAELAAHLDKIVLPEGVDGTAVRQVILANYAVFAPLSVPRRADALPLPVKHAIKLQPGAKPVISRRGRFNPQQCRALDKHLDELLADGKIEESQSEWAHAPLLCAKPGGGTRLVEDLRPVNAVTVPDAFPMPDADEAVESLCANDLRRGESDTAEWWFSKLDATSGFWQVELEESSRPLTAFATHRGLYQWKVMPMGLRNAPAVFNRLMQHVLRAELAEGCCRVFVDDVVVRGRGLAQLVTNLARVLGAFHRYDLRLSIKKLVPVTCEVEFLGRLVNGRTHTVQPLPERVKAIERIPVPTSVKQLQQFLGAAGWNRKFVPRYTDVARPLYVSLGTAQEAKFCWGLAQQQAFEKLKRLLASEPVLALPRTGTGTPPFVVVTDASKNGLGAVLLQESRTDKQLHPVGYWSRATRGAESRYAAIELEILAVAEACCNIWYHLLAGRVDTELWCDNAAVVAVMREHWGSAGKTPRNKRVARILIRLQATSLAVHHIDGKLNVIADLLSRSFADPAPNADRPVADNTENTVENKENAPPLLACLAALHVERDELTDDELDATRQALASKDADGVPWLADDWRRHQLGDADLAPLFRYLNGDRAAASTDLRLDAVKDSLVLSSAGVMHHVSPALAVGKRRILERHARDIRIASGVETSASLAEDCLTLDHPLLSRKEVRVVVPTALRTAIVDKYHAELGCGAHLSGRKTADLVVKRYWWPGILQEATNRADQCELCASRLGRPQRSVGPLVVPLPRAPMAVLHVDVLGPLPPAQGTQNTYLLVAVCRATHYPFALAVRNYTTDTLLAFLYARIFCQFGFPSVIVCDNGPPFSGAEFEEQLCKLGVRVRHSTPYWPRGNAPVERLNRTLADRIAVMARLAPDQWDRYVEPALLALRASPCRALQSLSPAEAMFGRSLRLRTELEVTENDYVDEIVPAQHAAALWTALAECEETRRSVEYAARRSGSSQPRQWQEGDYVYLFEGDAMRLAGTSEKPSKLAHEWVGPWVVTADIGGGSVRLALAEDLTKIRTVHGSLLKRCAQLPQHLQEADNQFEVLRVGGERRTGSERQYLVWWRNFNRRQASWEPAANIEKDCPDAVSEWRRAQSGSHTATTSSLSEPQAPTTTLTSAATRTDVPEGQGRPRRGSNTRQQPVDYRVLHSRGRL